MIFSMPTLCFPMFFRCALSKPQEIFDAARLGVAAGGRPGEAGWGGAGGGGGWGGGGVGVWGGGVEWSWV